MPKSTTLTLFILTLCGALLLAMAPGQPAALGSPPDPPDWYSDGEITDAAQIGDVLYVGGEFQRLSTASILEPLSLRNNLAAFDIHTGALLDWQPPATLTQVRLIKASQEHLYFVGSLSDRPGQNVHMLNPVTKMVTSWSAPLMYGTYDIALYNGKLILPLQSTTLGNLEFATLDPQTGTINRWPHFLNDWNSDHTIENMLVSGDTLYIGGGFDFFHDENNRNIVSNDLAAFNLQTGMLIEWVHGLPYFPDGPKVLGIAVYDNLLYVSGTFGRVGDQPRPCIAVFQLPDRQLINWQQPTLERCWYVEADADRLVILNTASSPLTVRVLDRASGTSLNWSTESPYAPFGLHIAGDLLFAYGGGQFTEDPDLIIAPLPAAPAPPTPTPTATAAPAERRERVYLPTVE